LSVQILNCGLSNTFSVKNALDSLGVDSVLVDDSKKLNPEDRIILPGVGAFGDGMEELGSREFIPILHEAIALGTPVLGICLGMQLLFESSCEFGEHEGLGVFPGKVRKLPSDQEGVKLPHMGWENLMPDKETSGSQAFYFVHSYYCEALPDHVVEKALFGSFEFPATVARDNVMGFQFHPEKSGVAGLNRLKDFCTRG